MVLLLVGLLSANVYGQSKSATLPLSVENCNVVVDANKDGTFDTVKAKADSNMEWRVGFGFDGPNVIVMEVKLPEDWQGKTVKINAAKLALCANGSHGTFPDNKPELAPDCVLYTYTGKQADGKVEASDVQDDKGNPVGTEVGLFIESQTPVKAGTVISCNVADAVQKAVDAKSAWVGFRLSPKVMPGEVACWRWRSPVFAAKYGKLYAPVLKLKVSVR